MKNMVYFFLLLLELDNYLESYAEITVEVKCTFLKNNAEGLYDATPILCNVDEPTHLTLNINDDRIVDVKVLELLTNCIYAHSWKMTSPNTFKRFTQLTDLIVNSGIFVASDAAEKEKFSTQLFNVPSLRNIVFAQCTSASLSDNVIWVLPPNLTHLTVSNCWQKRINWKEMKTLLQLRSQASYYYEMPELGYPSLQELDLSNTLSANITIRQLAPFCHLTNVSLGPKNTLTSVPCNCKLLKDWIKFLETQKTPMFVETSELQDVNDISCGSCKVDLTDQLKEAKKLREVCLSTKPPEATLDATLKISWPLWIYIVAAFLITIITFLLIALLTKRVSPLPLETPPPYLPPPEEEEEEEEEEEQQQQEEVELEG